MKKSKGPITVLAISSGGGHWLQLCRLASAWEGCRVVSACTADAPPMPGVIESHVMLQDATRWNLRSLWVLVPQVVRLMQRIRPDVVVTTGALPGLIAMMCGRLAGARTIWIDSLANVRQVSASGRLAGFVAHEWWTQWPHLADGAESFERNGRGKQRKPKHHGAVW